MCASLHWLQRHAGGGLGLHDTPNKSSAGHSATIVRRWLALTTKYKKVAVETRSSGAATNQYLFKLLQNNTAGRA